MRLSKLSPARLILVLLAAVLLVISSPHARAHHGWSSYDASKVIKIEAPVEVVRYVNPHGEIEITQDGKHWVVVLAPPSRMQARGLPREDLTVGTVVTVEGYPSRAHEGEMRAERIIVKGKTIELR